MSVEIVSGKFLAGDAAVNVECGFIPDSLQLLRNLAGTLVHYKWLKVLYDYAVAGTGKYGFIVDAALTRLGTANGGFIPYDTSVETVQLPAPDGHGFWKAASITDYNPLTTYTIARTAAVLGHAIRPTVHNGFVYECASVVGAPAGVDAANWGTVLGGITTDTGGNTWICRTERVARRGVKGFTVGVDLSTDGQYWAFEAKKHDRYTYMGDADAENPVLFADHDH